MLLGCEINPPHSPTWTEQISREAEKNLNAALIGLSICIHRRRTGRAEYRVSPLDDATKSFPLYGSPVAKRSDEIPMSANTLARLLGAGVFRSVRSAS
ncbi:hypothetical protein BaRGS_00025648 [Batillaria attramentaria]|uniref:Uncharacterized protein n=1 Tax=Batillaria attramentaria TaxID=370345 RepID=A0ABD0K6Q8_9CAEN